MPNEIEVGEYVRTDKGEIAKVTSIAKETLGEILGANEYRSIWFCYTKPYVYGNIVKHSKQRIDLIEVKDVIKYRINNISTTLETKGYVEGIVDISDEEMLQKIKSDKNYHILEILTKESYMANCYKVGGEDESTK